MMPAPPSRRLHRGAVPGATRARWVMALALALTARAAGADEPPPEARRHLDRGVALYNEGRFDEAVDELTAGLRVTPHPDLYYALGQAERRRGNCRRAVAAYRAFLRYKPPATEARRAEANIARCEQAIGPVAPDEPVTAPAATAPAAGAPAPEKPPAAPATSAPARAPAAAPGDGGMRVVGLGVVATGGLLFGTGIYFAARAASDWGEINDAAARHEAWSTGLQRRWESAGDAESNATILFVAGAATTVAGGVLYYLGVRAAARAVAGPVSAPSWGGPPGPVTAGVAPGPQSTKVTVRWTF